MKILATILINLVLIILLGAGAEFAFRQLDEPGKTKPVVELNLNFHPYVMWTSAMPRNGEWVDTVNGGNLPAQMLRNNYDFAIDDY